MNSLWNDNQAKEFANDPLALRVYTSRLLGQDSNLVLHGGGNTSVKASAPDLFGDPVDILYVKGSGWDLETIEKEGFAPVRMDILLKMAKLESLSDTDMVKNQRAAMLDPYAPNPSVEAILHAIIPFTYVDHTHADAAVTVTNSPNGEERIKEIYGDRALIIPYVMPGFILAKKVYDMTRDFDWSSIDTMILMNHGVFTFNDDAKTSYENMIRSVSQCEEYIAKQGATVTINKSQGKENLLELAKIRRHISALRGGACLAQLHADDNWLQYANLNNIKDIANRGPLTPDHIIRTKRAPVIIDSDVENVCEDYAIDYEKYFDQFKVNGLSILDKAPRWGVWPDHGCLSFGCSVKEATIIHDITEHTVNAIQSAEKLGGWEALPQQDLFDVEYWELEQAKLKKAGQGPEFQGKIALVTGAASGIGRSCVEALLAKGAVVGALDLDEKVNEIFSQESVLSIVCDVTREEDIHKAIESVVRKFGGLDLIVSNAGIFPQSSTIAEMDEGLWQKSMDVNLTAHQILFKHAVPFLECGIDSAIVIIGSKNVPAPGPGAAAYSVAKAGLTQLARIAALELASKGIRVNTAHPNQIFDTAIWTDDVLAARAKSYNLSVEEYKTNNLLRTEITSHDVANLVCEMLGSTFAKTTAAQIPIDGGNERVI